MKFAVLGFNGPLARATRAALESRGHTATDLHHNLGCAIYLPGPGGRPASPEAEQILSAGIKRLVLRSHAYVYGSNAKNPGMMTEERISLLPPRAPEQRWLRLEQIAARHPNSAIVRLSNVLSPAEGDLIVNQLCRTAGIALAGHDPNLQFLSLEDAASALASAAESRATGTFNVAGAGAVPLKKAFRASGTHRLPLPKPLARLLRSGKSVDQMQYNWTVCSERACRELDWRPRQSSAQALAAFVGGMRGSNPDLLASAFDDWGLDVQYIRAWGAWFWFLRNIYWRIDYEGMENIPDAGRALLVSNHRGFMPLDAVMHLSLILTHRQRIPRFLIISSLLRFPFLCNFLTKLGGVIANQENTARLFAAENLVGIFPEGIRGSFLPYRRAYQLRDFSKSGFTKMAIEHQAPIIPAAVVGHAEIFPIIGRIDSSYVAREWGWPYLPIAPMFPLAPIPIPSKWHVRVLPAVPFHGLKPTDAENPRIVKQFAHHIQRIVQANVDDMRSRRKHIFWGKVLNGSAPAFETFVAPLSGAMGSAR
jgi:1-acyl-sn-glycerol-3-phosphate acyltransferase